jgi:hypothetical protein
MFGISARTALEKEIAKQDDEDENAAAKKMQKKFGKAILCGLMGACR